MFCKPPHPVYIVLFRGDDTDFVGNQEIIVKITTERDISGCKAYFKYMGNIQTFDVIPEDKELHLVFSREQTKDMPLGTWDAELYLIDEQGRRMTVNNRIHMLVTNSVREAYCPEDPQAVSVVISANKYIEDAEVSADGKTLTLTKKDGTEVSFSGGGGGGGTNDYNDLENKPSINGATLTGNVNLATPEQLSLKADKATTLAGYGITDAATKSELESVSSVAGGAMNVAVDARQALLSKADLVDGKVPANQLPSYVDDVLEYDSVSAFPSTGEDGKIYVAKDTNKTYRWGGTQYVEISQSLALGETAETAYPGDKGKAAADKANAAYSAAESLTDGVNSLAGTIGSHIRDTKNPHKVTAAQVGAVQLVEDVNSNKTAVTIGTRGSGGTVGQNSLANGNGVTASGVFSHAEGNLTMSEGDGSHTDGHWSMTRKEDEFAYSWNGDKKINVPYSSHGKGTFNINPVGGVDGFYIGDQTLSAIIFGSVTNNISADNPTFSHAVLAVGLNIDTNSVAVLNEIAATFGGFPIEGTATTVGGLLAALAAAVAWLRKNKADKATTLAGYGITDAATKTELALKADKTDLDALAAKVDTANAALEEVA